MTTGTSELNTQDFIAEFGMTSQHQLQSKEPPFFLLSRRDD